MYIRTPHMFFRGPEDEFTGRFYCNIEGAGDEGAGAGAGAGGAPPPPPAAAPWSAAGDKPWMVGEGANAKPWWEVYVPEQGAREHIAAKQYANPAVLAVANYNLTKLHTGNGNVVEIPGENATQEQRDAFFSKLGRPVDATKYDLSNAWAEDLKSNPEFKPNEGLVKFGQNVAFKLGLNNQQAHTLAAEYRQYENSALKAQTEADQRENDIALEGLKKSYGAEYDAYLAAGQRAYNALGLDDKTTAAIEKSMGAAPLVDLLCRIGRASGEGGFQTNNGGGGGQGNNPDSMTPEAAAAEIERLSGDAEFQKVYTTRTDPGNRSAIERMNRLYARAGDKVRQ